MADSRGTPLSLTQEVTALRELLTSRLEALEKSTDQRFDAQEKAVNTALHSQEKSVAAALLSADRAVTKAESASDRKFESVNEYRQSLSEQSRLYMPRLETEQIVRSVHEKIDTTNTRLDALSARLDLRQEHGRGAADVWGWVVAGIASLTAVGVFIMALVRHQ